MTADDRHGGAPSVSRAYSRRQAIKVASGSALALSAASRLSLTSRAQTPASPGTDPTQIVLPETGITLPTGDVTFRWVDSGDSKALFFRAYFDAFTRAHPNITFDYLGLPWTEIEQIVPLGVRNGNAPDVFQVPPSVPVAEAVREGWVRPIDDLIPNFAEWQAAFPPASFVEGVNVFSGRVYTFPVPPASGASTLPSTIDPIWKRPATTRRKPR